MNFRYLLPKNSIIKMLIMKLVKITSFSYLQSKIRSQWHKKLMSDLVSIVMADIGHVVDKLASSAAPIWGHESAKRNI